MRYQITLPSHVDGGLDTVLSETEHLDFAEATARYAPFDVVLLDTYSHRVIPVARVRWDAEHLLTEEQLPWSSIDSLLMQSKKIYVIKLIRELTAFGLGEAKAIADRRDAKLRLEARNRDRDF